MKQLVCISNVPDTTTKISFTDNDTAVNTSGVQFIINPYDEWYSLVRAIEIKEAQGGTVTILHVGTAESEPTIRKGLAIGADDAVRIDIEANDAYAVAEQVAAYAKDQAYDIVYVGKETISYNGSMVGGMLAELLNVPFVSITSKLEIADKVATIEHDIDGGTEVVECPLPMVISTNKGMSEARIPNMRGIMAARSKPLTVVPAAATEALTTISEYKITPGRTDCVFVDGSETDKLIEMLHTQAKVI